MAKITCYRCGCVIDTAEDRMFSITTWRWKPRRNGIAFGEETGRAYLCGKCADGLEEYLDEIWRKRDGKA